MPVSSLSLSPPRLHLLSPDLRSPLTTPVNLTLPNFTASSACRTHPAYQRAFNKSERTPQTKTIFAQQLQQQQSSIGLPLAGAWLALHVHSCSLSVSLKVGFSFVPPFFLDLTVRFCLPARVRFVFCCLYSLTFANETV